MSSIVMAIKPEYVNRILCGEKRFEFRKRLATLDVDEIYIYCTFPVMKIVAKVEVIATLTNTPKALWNETKEEAGISYKNYQQYFKKCKTACAYKLGNVMEFDSPKALSEFGISYPPQSFVYVHSIDITP